MIDEVEQRVRAAEYDMAEMLSTRLYADDPAKESPPWTLIDWLREWKWRFIGAWDILRGRADPYSY